MDLDYAKVEAAETEIDKFINRRAEGREEANAIVKAWEESERRHKAKLAEERCIEWAQYYAKLASSHAKLSEHFEEKALEVSNNGYRTTV